ncbi:MAG: hypothetical protein ACRDKE_11270 [Solirubrobacterales bacterium]
MGMTARDQKVLAVVVALVVLGGYWFLVVGKKKSAIAEAQEAQVTAQADLDASVAAETAALSVAKVKPAAYSRLLRLGKAIPADKDFESLLVQVNDITVDSLVSFVSLTAAPSATTSVKPGGASETTTCDTGASGGASGSTAAAPASPATGATGTTGSTAVSSVGQDRDAAKGAVSASDASGVATENAANKVSCDNSPTLTDIAATAAGLETETYTFTFTGSFYRLKDVYNGLLDMVEVRNGRVAVSGRLLDINSISMSVAKFPNLTATVQMTGYKLPDATTSSGAEIAGAPSGGSLAADATATANSENQSAEAAQ